MEEVNKNRTQGRIKNSRKLCLERIKLVYDLLHSRKKFSLMRPEKNNEIVIDERSAEMEQRQRLKRRMCKVFIRHALSLARVNVFIRCHHRLT